MVIRKEPLATKEGYIFDTQVLRLELYRLLTTIIASEQAYENSDFSSLFSEFQEDQILITLTTIATTARIIDDREKKYLNKFDTDCGKLTIWNNKKQRTVKLNLREACNKLIHAKKVRFEVFDKYDRDRLKPLIHLYGTKNKKKWKATLFLLEFIKKIENLVYT